MKYVDLFAGIGGFRRGLDYNGFECILSCEKNDKARISYSAIHDENYNDIIVDVNNLDEVIRKVGENNVELVCGGFPCQPFSRSGKREGFKDKNKGSLFFSTLDIIENLKPNVVLLENVKGLLSVGEVITTPENEPNVEVDKGSTFKDILFELSQLGYNVEWQVINSAHFSSQKRERVFIHAEKISKTFKSIFPLPTVKNVTIDVIKENGVVDYLLHLSKLKGPNDENLIKSINDVNKFYIVNGVLLNEDKSKYKFQKNTPFQNWGIMVDDIIYTTRVNHTIPKPAEYLLSDILLSDKDIEVNYHYEILSNDDVEKQVIAKGPKTWRTGNKMGRMSFPDKKDKPSRTLTAGSTGRELMVIEHKLEGRTKYRKLTALEYLRLQGFEDADYIKMSKAHVSVNQIKKQAGNAVTVDVIREIGKRLKEE